MLDGSLYGVNCLGPVSSARLVFLVLMFKEGFDRQQFQKENNFDLSLQKLNKALNIKL